MPSSPIHVYVPGSGEDPRAASTAPAGVVVHHGPPLHPDDLVLIDGVPVTSPARTLIDLAEEMDPRELRRCFGRARALGLLDADALRAARSRVEWRPSLSVVDPLIAEFTRDGAA